ncbi:MAG TPA: hypothetical protein VM618_13560 [Acidimicrobiia bacterium]|nr:hypothetical protein [Acidimicrobiia bacterium]
MLRKLLIAAAATVVAASLSPTSAQAAPQDTAGVVIFTGDAYVGSQAYQGAPGQGLCLPGMTASAGACVVNPNLAPGPNGWVFDVPGQDVALPLGVGKLTGSCNAYGRFGGIPVVTSDIPGVASGNCHINADGLTGAVSTVNAGASCAMGSGWSSAGTPDTFQVEGVPAGPLYTEWVASAGTLLPIVGSAVYNGQTAGYAGLVVVNASPQSPSGVPCVNEPATTFTVIGVVAAGEAVPDLSGVA